MLNFQRMPRRCAYLKCTSDSSTFGDYRNPAIRLHDVPEQDREFVSEMFGIIKPDSQKIKLCSLHFRAEAFLKLKQGGIKPYLKKDIVFREVLILPPGKEKHVPKQQTQTVEPKRAEPSEPKASVADIGQFEVVFGVQDALDDVNFAIYISG